MITHWFLATNTSPTSARLIGHPRRLLDRRIESEHLLDDGRRPPGIFDQQLPLLPVGQQPAHAVTDRVDGGFEAGDEKEPHQCRQLCCGDFLALLSHERRHQIIAGVRSAPVEQLGECGPELSVGGRQRPGLAERPDAIQGPSDRRAQPPEPFRIIGQTKEVGHYRNGQWRGEGGHEVELALAFALVEQLAGSPDRPTPRSPPSAGG